MGDYKDIISFILSIISGIFVYYITEIISNRKRNKIYEEKLKNANYEIIHSIKPIIFEDKSININFIEAIYNTISYNYKILKNDLIDPKLIMDKICTEISQSFFLGSSQKKEYIDNLLVLKENYLNDKERKDSKELINFPTNNRRYINKLSIAFGISSSLSISYLLLLNSYKYSNINNVKYSYNDIYLITLTIPIIFIVFFIIIQLIRFRKEEREMNRRIKSMINDTNDINNTFEYMEEGLRK